jgi:hypothetical protein
MDTWTVHIKNVKDGRQAQISTMADNAADAKKQVWDHVKKFDDNDLIIEGVVKAGGLF